MGAPVEEKMSYRKDVVTFGPGGNNPDGAEREFFSLYRKFLEGLRWIKGARRGPRTPWLAREEGRFWVTVIDPMDQAWRAMTPEEKIGAESAVSKIALEYGMKPRRG